MSEIIQQAEDVIRQAKDEEARADAVMTAADVRRKSREQPWVSVEEVMILWSIPRRTVYHMIDKGALRAKRFGRFKRIASESVVELDRA